MSNKADKITAIKGMNDLLPAEAHLWEIFENTAQSVLQSYGFQQIRTPIVEETRLFSRAIGAVTDIVEKEMYSFEDSMNGDKLTLRPEGTAGVVRAVLARVAGANHPATGLPTNVLLLPRSVDPSTRPGTTAFGRFDATGPLSSADAPYVPSLADPSEDGSLPCGDLESAQAKQVAVSLGRGRRLRHGNPRPSEVAAPGRGADAGQIVVLRS